MKKIFLALLVSCQLFAAAPVSENGGYELNRNGALNRKYAVGTALANGPFGAKAQYNFATQGGAANADIPLKDLDGQNVIIPTNAIITDCMIDVAIQPASATSSAKLALSSSAVGDLKAAALAHVTYVPSATGTTIACIPINATHNTHIRMASDATLKIRMGSEALTQGKINVWVEYVLSN